MDRGNRFTWFGREGGVSLVGGRAGATNFSSLQWEIAQIFSCFLESMSRLLESRSLLLVGIAGWTGPQLQ